MSSTRFWYQNPERERSSQVAKKPAKRRAPSSWFSMSLVAEKGSATMSRATIVNVSEEKQPEKPEVVRVGVAQTEANPPKGNSNMVAGERGQNLLEVRAPFTVTPVQVQTENRLKHQPISVHSDQVKRASWSHEDYSAMKDYDLLQGVRNTRRPHSLSGSLYSEDGSIGTPRTVKKKVFNYHQYEQYESSKSTIVSFSRLVLTRATDCIPANLKMTVIRNHVATQMMEISVQEGEPVSALYQVKGSVFIVKRDDSTGFIPFNACFISSLYHKDKQKGAIFSRKYRISSDSQEEGMRKAIAISSYKASTQFEISVNSQDTVYLLCSDGEWVYAVTKKQESGFLPRSVCLIVSKGVTRFHPTGEHTPKRVKSRVTASFTLPTKVEVKRVPRYLKVTRREAGQTLTAFEEVNFSELILRRASEKYPASLLIVAVEDYTPDVELDSDELSVHLNERLFALYKKGNRIFACARNGQSGYLPANISHSCGGYKKDSTKFSTVYKKYAYDASVPYVPPKVMVLQQYRARTDSELSVHMGDFLSALFYDDEWVYGVTEKRRAGFVPSSYCHLNVQN